MDIKATDVKALRDRTGAGMMDCKKALVESSGNVEDAIDWLRKKGLAAAAKKAGRVAAEGLVGVCSNGKEGSIIEVNAETDFVARNELFQKFVSDVACLSSVHKTSEIELLKDVSYSDNGKTVYEELANLIAVIGENMILRRAAYLKVENGIVAHYVHNKTSPSLGKIGILVALESTADKNDLLELGKQLAMHIAAANPSFLAIKDVDSSVLDRERAIVSEQAKASGKMQEFIDKIVVGRIRKFYEEIVLLEQVFVMDSTVRVKDVLENASKKFGCSVKISAFVKFVLGEGIEKQVVDFASEVAAQLN